MVRKELFLGLLAYNLIRGWMALAAKQAHLHPASLSLARCWRRIIDASQCFPVHSSAHDLIFLCEGLLDRLAACQLPVRKHPRYEPRGVWGKPQPYISLKGSRSQATSLLLHALMKC